MECTAELKSNLLVGHLFLGCSTFDPWGGVSRHPYEDVFGSIFRCYTAYYSGQVDEWRARMAAGPSSRGEASGGTSVADTASLVVAPGSQQGTTSPAEKRRRGVKRVFDRKNRFE